MSTHNTVFKECLVKKKGALPGATFIVMYPPILEGGGGGGGMGRHCFSLGCLSVCPKIVLSTL